MHSASPTIRFAPPAKLATPAVQPLLEQLLTKDQAAKLSALSLGTINNAIAAGELPALRLGTAVRIEPAALRAWWASRSTKPSKSET